MVAFSFAVLTGILILVAFYVSYRRKQFRKKKALIKELIDTVISGHMMWALDENESQQDDRISPEVIALMRSVFNRKVMTAELVKARKNFSGKAGQSIQLLYEQLKLPNHSAGKLHSRNWQRQAGAVQELSIMRQKQYWKKIYKLTNHKNDHLRMEAQSGIIRLLGFSGLRFLNATSHQITQWQQINLLHLLKNIPAHDVRGIDTWLQSTNSTVVIFTLKLIAQLKKYEFHAEVLKHLSHPDADIANEANKTLATLGLEKNETTA